MRHTHYSYHFRFAKGEVSLVPETGGRFQVVFENQGLGSYHSPESAIDDVVGGHTFAPSSDWDFDEFEISDDLSEWEARVYMKNSGFRPTK